MAYRLTKQEIVQEIIKCGKSPGYFINTFAKISHPLKGLIPFKLYDFQEDTIKDFNNYRFNVILKGRQLGISTTIAAYTAWLMLFHRDKNILVVATKLATATNLVKKVKLIIKSLPSWLLISKITIDNRGSFELSNNSQIKASSTATDAGRSEALTLLIVDEAAIIEGMDELWAGLYPTLSTGGRCIAVSTPYGVGNWFHRTYTEAEEEKNDFNSMKLPWSVHPERDDAWFKKETRNMSSREIAQELECNFNFSGETLLHGDDLERLQKECCEPQYKTGYDRNFWIWKNYEPGKKYFLVADVARGDGKDFSAFHIFDSETMEQVAEYQGKANIDMYAQTIYDASKEYGFCLTVVENNSIGLAALNKLVDMQHPNLFYSVKSTNIHVDQFEAQNLSNSIAGVTISSRNRPLIIAKLEEFIRNKLITINSKRLANEFKTFIWNNGKAEAMRSYNDDLVMSCAIACWVRDTALVVNQREMEYRRALVDAISTDGKVFHTKIHGQEGYRQETGLPAEKKKYTDFSWLFKG